MRIEDINVRQVLTKGLQKTVEVEIKTKRGIDHSIAPVNKNGIYRIHSLPMEEAIKKFLEIKRHFVNQAFDNTQEVDSFLHDIDISIDFREIGGNLAFAISSAFLKAFARWESIRIYEYLLKNKPELPVPLCIVANKGKSRIDFKEFLLYQVQQKTFSNSIMKLVDVYNKLNLIRDDLMSGNIMKTLSNVTTKNSLEIGINLGATDIWNERRYVYSTGESLTPQEQLMLVQDLATNHPIGYIEDPFHEDDFVLFSTLTHRLPTRLVVGNELYSDNFEKLKRGIDLKATSGITITPTKMGTITDVMNMAKEARKNKIATVIPNEMDGDLISNLAVGLRFDYIKLGMDSASVDIMNELIRIENKI